MVEEWAARREADTLHHARMIATVGLTLAELRRLTPTPAKAAPEMYEALKTAQTLAVFAATRDCPLPGAKELDNFLRRVIAKVEGREE